MRQGTKDNIYGWALLTAWGLTVVIVGVLAALGIWAAVMV